ncbi:MAG: alpha/beta fold hydrolase [Aeromicrobium sp.]
MNTSQIAVKPGAEPFSADGGPVGVLLSHGFTGSPASMTPWGRDLARRGHTVRVPRLPGHGTTWQQMNTTRWTDWYGELDDALTELRARCETVAVGGLSMGGCLALKLAQDRPADVDSLVLVNPAINLRRFDVKLVPALQHLLPSMPGIGNDIKKPGEDEVGYDKTPLKALASQLKIWKQVRANLDKVTAPVLLFRSDEDHVVDDSTKDLILAGVSSDVIEYMPLSDSYHVATIDNDASTIFEQSASFIEAHARGVAGG